MSDKLALYRGWVGLDLMTALSRDERLRPVLVNGEYVLSLVSLMEIFGDENNKTTIRHQWRDEKKRLLKRKPELGEKISQLKLVAEDGKLRLTDVANLETCFRILFYMNTPASDEFKDMVATSLARISDAQLRHRAMSIANGTEWAADTIHQHLLDEHLLEDES